MKIPNAEMLALLPKQALMELVEVVAHSVASNENLIKEKNKEIVRFETTGYSKLGLPSEDDLKDVVESLWEDIDVSEENLVSLKELSTTLKTALKQDKTPAPVTLDERLNKIVEDSIDSVKKNLRERTDILEGQIKESAESLGLDKSQLTANLAESNEGVKGVVELEHEQVEINKYLVRLESGQHDDALDNRTKTLLGSSSLLVQEGKNDEAITTLEDQAKNIVELKAWLTDFITENDDIPMGQDRFLNMTVIELETQLNVINQYKDEIQPTQSAHPVVSAYKEIAQQQKEAMSKASEVENTSSKAVEIDTPLTSPKLGKD